MFTFRKMTACFALWGLLAATAPVEARSRKGEKLMKDGHVAEDRRDYDKALQLYEEALRIDPSDSSYQLAVRRVRFQAGQAHVDAGQKLRKDGKLEEALTEFQKAYATDPSSIIAEQELRRTAQMIERERKKSEQGVPQKPDEKSLTPAEQARKDIEDKVASLMPAPELRPVSRQITTLKMNNQPVKVLFETIGKIAGINVIFDSDYQVTPGKNYSVDLANTTLEDALEYVATLTKSFWKPLSSNTIFITNDNVAKRRDYEDHVVKVFYLRNMTTVQELQEVATNIRSITDIRRVFTYNSQNAIIVRGSVDQVALAEKIVTDLDKAKPEVLVDVVVMEANRSRTRDLAATIISGSTNGIRIPIGFTPRSQLAVPSASGSSGTNGSTGGGASGSSSSAILAENIGKLNFSDYSLALPSGILQALMTDRTTRVLQTPQVRMADGMKGSLKIGDRFPYATGSFAPGIGAVGVSPLVSTQFQFAEVGVNVDIQPRVHGGDEVTMHIEVDVSNVKDRIDVGGLSQPIIGQRKIITDIRLREGEVSLLGGLMQAQDTRSSSGVPGLGNVPILKWLFASDSRDKENQELLIALVPHVVRSPEITADNLKGVAAGNDQQVKLNYGPRRSAEPHPATPAAPAPPTAPPAPPKPEETKPAETKPAEAKPPAPAGGMRVSFNPPAIEAKPGANFTVALQIDSATDIFSAPLKVRFDPKVLRVVEVKPGTFLSGDGQRTVFSENTLNDAGETSVLLNRVPGAGGISGSGPLAIFTFQAVAPGTAKITVTELTLRNSTLQPSAAAPAPELNVTIK